MNKIDVMDFDGIEKIVVEQCNLHYNQGFWDRLKNFLYMNCRCGTLTITKHSGTKRIEGQIFKKSEGKV